MAEFDAPSLDTILGRMDPEELLRVGGLLEELRESEGFLAFDGLVRAQVRKAESQLTAKPMPDVQSYAYAAGTIRGLRQGGAIIDKVLEKARAVRAELEREAREVGEA